MPIFDGLYDYGPVTTATTCLGYGDESLIDPKHKVKVYGERLCTDTGHKGATLMGLVTRYAHVCRKCPCNLHNALCNRHLKVQPVMTGDLQAAYDYFDGDRQLLKYRYDEILPNIRRDWMSKWSKSKRESIMKSLMSDPYLFDQLAPFVKREISVSDDNSPPSKARAIQGYKNMVSQYVTARAITAAQKAFARVYGVKPRRDIDVCFASGLSSKSLGDWMTESERLYGKCWFYERDGKNWDATMNEHHFALKMHVLSMMVDEENTLTAVRAGYKCRATARFGKFGEKRISYSVEGTVKSGHNDTSLGNSIVNAGIAIAAMRKLGLKGRILVMGDDLLVALPNDFDADSLAEAERELGINPEYRKFDSPYDVTFISQMWYPTGRPDHMYFTGPKPGRILSKLFWTTKPPAQKHCDKWVHSVCQGLLPTCGSIPVLRAWLLKHDRDSRTTETAFKGKDLKWFRHLDLHYEKVDVDPKAVLEMFERKYRTTAVDIARLESKIMRTKLKCGVVVDELLDVICSRDLADLPDRQLY